MKFDFTLFYRIIYSVCSSPALRAGKRTSETYRFIKKIYALLCLSRGAMSKMANI